MWLQGWCSAHCYSIVFLILFLKGEFAVPPGTHGSDIKYYFPESFVFFGIQHRMFTPGNWEMWNGVNEMLFNVTEDGEPDIRPVERRVGCWIDASEFFFLFFSWRKKKEFTSKCVCYRFWKSASEISAP